MKNKRVIVLLCICLSATSCNTYHLHRLKAEQSVSHFKMLEVNGVYQSVLIRGNNVNNPVLLYLHGGPGFPLLPFEPRNEVFHELEQYFTLVYWEQRGTGKSFRMSIPSRSMNLDQFIEDARVVAGYVTTFLDKDGCYIWGHSWGSGVASLYAARYPEHIKALITTGQSVNPFENENLGYKFVKNNALKENNRRALRQLQWIDTIPENYTLQDALTIRKWVYYFGGIVKENQNERPYVDIEEMHDIISAPEYSLRERLNILFFPLYSARKLWNDLKTLNLFEDAPQIDVPVYFLLGRYDVIVSSRLAESYFNYLKAPSGKKLIWFESSAHRPFSEERQKFVDIMLSIRQTHSTQPTTGSHP